MEGCIIEAAPHRVLSVQAPGARNGVFPYIAFRQRAIQARAVAASFGAGTSRSKKAIVNLKMDKHAVIETRRRGLKPPAAPQRPRLAAGEVQSYLSLAREADIYRTARREAQSGRLRYLSFANVPQGREAVASMGSDRRPNRFKLWELEIYGFTDEILPYTQISPEF